MIKQTKQSAIYHPLYRTWDSMKSRCLYPCNNRYHLYGGKGIKVCDEWRHDFWQFVRDMGPKPDPSYTLDRIDGNGNYEPANCRWASIFIQNQNRNINKPRPKRTSANTWLISIKRNGKRFRKTFKTYNEAIEAGERFIDSFS